MPYLAGFVTPQDYGALGNNSNDDTSAINTAITTMSAAGGGTLFFPPATYKTTAAIVGAANVNLLGAGQGISVINQTSTTANGITFNPSSGNLVNPSITNLSINGPSSGSGIGVLLESGTGSNLVINASVSNVTVSGFGSTGFNLVGGVNCVFTNCYANNVAGNGGFYINGGTGTVLSGCHTDTATTSNGFSLLNSVYASLEGCKAFNCSNGFLLTTSTSCSLQACGADTTTTNGFEITGGNGNTLLSCTSNVNKAVAIYLTGSTTNAVVLACQETNPNAATNSLRIDAGVTSFTLNNNFITATSIAAGTNALTYPGNETVAGTLGVTGNTSLSTVSTSGAATLNSAVITNGATVGTTLGVTGNTTLSTVSTSGLATLSSASVTNNATVGGTLGVTGTSTFTGLLTASGGITSPGSYTATGTGMFTSQPTAGTNTALSVNIGGSSAFDQLRILGSGQIALGPGTAGRTGFFGFASTNTVYANPNLVVGAQAGLGDNGSGELQLADAGTKPTTAPTAGTTVFSQSGAALPLIAFTPNGNKASLVDGLFVLTGANTTFTSATQTATTVAVAVESSATYLMESVEIFSNTTGNTTFSWTGPTGATMQWNDTTATLDYTSTITGTGFTWTSNAGTRMVIHKGYLVTAATAGTLTLTVAVSAGTTTLNTGSYLRLTRVK